jgi:hypothetical protein
MLEWISPGKIGGQRNYLLWRRNGTSGDLLLKDYDLWVAQKEGDFFD